MNINTQRRIDAWVGPWLCGLVSLWHQWFGRPADTAAPVQRVLEDAKLKKSDIDEIVLVGGSTRIPKVQQLIKDELITAMVRELALQSQLIARDVDQWILRVERESLNQPGSRDRLTTALQDLVARQYTLYNEKLMPAFERAAASMVTQLTTRMEADFRIGGTMEIAGLNEDINPVRGRGAVGVCRG